MLSSVWQRIGMAVGILLGSLGLIGILPSLHSTAGTPGILLGDSQYGLFACLLVAIAGIPALVCATFLTTIGRFTNGITVLCGSLLVLAYLGGSSMGWIQRSQLPGDFWQLIIEMLLWQIMLLAGITLIFRFRPAVHSRMPELLRRRSQWKTVLNIPGGSEIVAAVITSVIALVLTYILIRNTSEKQVIGALILSFALASGIGQTMMPNTNPLVIFMSPCLVAITGYLLAMVQYDSSLALTEALFQGSEPGVKFGQQFAGPALALPIHYASAGLLGCCIGIGIVRSAVDEALEDEANEEIQFV